MRSGLLLASVAAAAMGALAIVAACNDPEQHVYSAQPFDTTNTCLGPYQAIDVVSGGGGASTCAPQCLVNGGAVYVSTVCPPFPDPTVWDTSGQNPACAGALAAFARGDVCSPDGGSSNPIVVPEAGAPADDGGGDAASADDGANGDAASADAASE